MNLLPALQAADVPHGVGLEFLPILSFIIPAVLLLIIIVLGNKNTV